MTSPPSDREDDLLTWLQGWYERHCDGDWEHSWGVTIGTLDNPWWRVEINLVETELAGRAFRRVERDRSATDWIRCWVEDERFHAAGGARNLGDVLAVFRAWAEGAAGTEIRS